MSEINKIVGKNIKTFLESRKLNNTWVIDRIDINKNAFYDMLNGKGCVDIHVAKINKLFGIKDPLYFYQTNFDYTKSKNRLNRKDVFFKHIDLSHSEDITSELNEGFEVFLEFVELIDILKATTK
ncbi:TPA: hypothetical protein ACGXMW_002258 [Bacillus paranthracis]